MDVPFSMFAARRTTLLALLAALGLAACDGGEGDARRANAHPAAASRDTSAVHPAAAIVDSARPIEEELRRFREGLPPTAALQGGAGSRDALIREFMTAVNRADTAALRRLALTRAEYAWLVYPESPLAGPPYNQPPGLAWMLLQQASNTGATRLLQPAPGGRGWRLLGSRCPDAPVREGANRLWRRCEVHVVRPDGDTVWARLFGVIVQRDGRFKFVGYDNDF